ncbi:hypothetical protein COLO4_02867 [Corchorus olitorius]|uniref:Uncharacterized protein n=1 Tax=Corchorus olitorius TaxID=93759 RepID=A0A1R3L017_9ROSI|nr:hypothetical protein COLO4_02867 [Corchorus olitorius]
MVDAIYCLMVKFPTPTGIGYMSSNQRTLRSCHLESLILPTRDKTRAKLGRVLGESYTGSKRTSTMNERTSNSTCSHWKPPLLKQRHLKARHL